MPKHTKGPRLRASGAELRTDGGDLVADFTFSTLPASDRRRIQARIVACVNACEGIEDPSVVPELIEAIRLLLNHRGMMGSPSWAKAEALLARIESKTV